MYISGLVFRRFLSLVDWRVGNYNAASWNQWNFLLSIFVLLHTRSLGGVQLPYVWMNSTVAPCIFSFHIYSNIKAGLMQRFFVDSIHWYEWNSSKLYTKESHRKLNEMTAYNQFKVVYSGWFLWGDSKWFCRLSGCLRWCMMNLARIFCHPGRWI